MNKLAQNNLEKEKKEITKESSEEKLYTIETNEFSNIQLENGCFHMT